MNNIYVVFSATPYLIGKAIRHVTGQTYNHVSIALDENLTQMYGFARRFYRTPLYGGFVKETLSRYQVNGKATQICVCKLPVTEDQYNALAARLNMMFSDQNRYIYNHLSAMGALIRKPVKAVDAYTCVEFCVSILQDLGIDIDPEKYYATGDILQMLQNFIIYTGPMPASIEIDSEYYAKKPTPHPILFTLRDIFKLIPRLSK